MMEKYIDKTLGLGERTKTTSKINRRTFLKGGIATGAALWGMGAMLGKPRTAFAQTPKYGGKLTTAMIDSPVSLDPGHMADFTAYWAGNLIYDKLVYLNPDMTVSPNLATSWKSLEKGKVWIFNLRKGVKFHNGRELKAKDVATYFNRVMNPKEAASAKKRLAPLESAEVLDDYTVKVNLSIPSIDFPNSLGEPTGSIIAPESAGRETNNPIGTGAFKLKEYMPGEKLVFVKNKNYWKKGLPYLDVIQFTIMPDIATQVSALVSGEIDTFREISKDFVDVLKRKKDIVIEEVPTGAIQPIVMQMSKKPFNDPRVVQAIKLCVDREKFVDLVLNGHGVPANDTNIPPNHLFYHGIPIKKQDYKLAKKLLADAGYPNGLDLELYTSYVRVNMVESALTLKDMCAPVGIRINVKTWPPQTYWKEVWRHKSFFVSNWVGRVSVHDYLYQYFHEDSFDHENPGGLRDVNNTSQYINHTASRLLEQGSAEAEFEKRVDIYKMAQAIIMETAGWVVPYNANYMRAKRREVQNLPMHPTKWCDLSVCWKSD